MKLYSVKMRASGAVEEKDNDNSGAIYEKDNDNSGAIYEKDNDNSGALEEKDNDILSCEEKDNDILSCDEKDSYTLGIEKKTRHISGAEKIVEEKNLERCIAGLVKRAMNHPKGTVESINIKIEHVKEDEITYLEPLKVRTIEVQTKEEGWAEIKEVLKSLGMENGQEVLNFMEETYSMRGAMVLDYKTMIRVEPNKERGVRATNMDFEAMSIEGIEKEMARCYEAEIDSKVNSYKGISKENNNLNLGVNESEKKTLSSNNHFKEALVLATKVVSHPNILAEICISDDPNYTTGYIASKEFGYVRITNLKELGDENGGRIFLYNGKAEEVKACINYIEKEHVLVRNNLREEE